MNSAYQNTMTMKRTNKNTKIAKGAVKGGKKGGTNRRRGGGLNPFRSRLSAHVTEEGEWISGPPNITLSRMFLVVLLLHIVVVGGILAYEMLNNEPVAPVALDAVKPISSDPDGISTGSGSRISEAEGVGGAPSYRVRAGDTLSQIAKLHNVPASELMSINRLGGSDQIYAGQVLVIPPRGKAPGGVARGFPELPGMLDGDSAEIVPAGLTGKLLPVPGETEAGAGSPTGALAGTSRTPNLISVPPVEAGRSHKVEVGETAFAISKRFGVTVDALLAANGITDARNLPAGKVIRIP